MGPICIIRNSITCVLIKYDYELQNKKDQVSAIHFTQKGR